jgi:hypothetical protein
MLLVDEIGPVHGIVDVCGSSLGGVFGIGGRWRSQVQHVSSKSGVPVECGSNLALKANVQESMVLHQ